MMLLEFVCNVSSAWRPSHVCNRTRHCSRTTTASSSRHLRQTVPTTLQPLSPISLTNGIRTVNFQRRTRIHLLPSTKTRDCANLLHLFVYIFTIYTDTSPTYRTTTQRIVNADLNFTGAIQTTLSYCRQMLFIIKTIQHILAIHIVKLYYSAYISSAGIA